MSNADLEKAKAVHSQLLAVRIQEAEKSGSPMELRLVMQALVCLEIALGIGANPGPDVGGQELGVVGGSSYDFWPAHGVGTAESDELEIQQWLNDATKKLDAAMALKLRRLRRR